MPCLLDLIVSTEENRSRHGAHIPNSTAVGAEGEDRVSSDHEAEDRQGQGRSEEVSQALSDCLGGEGRGSSGPGLPLPGLGLLYCFLGSFSCQSPQTTCS